MEKFKLKSFEEFKKELKPLPPPVILTEEEVREKVKPMIIEQIRRILHPTEDEKKQLQEYIKKMDEWDFTWDLVLNEKGKE